MKKYRKTVIGSILLAIALSALPPAVRASDTEKIDSKYLLGMINKPSRDALFTKVDKRYTENRMLYMHKEAYQAFIKMQDAAEKSGVKLTIKSALRTFHNQKVIWEQKWLGKRKVDGLNLATSEPNHFARALIILRFSSMPGTSRHHWGTDIDLNSLENSYFESGQGKKVYDWLTANGPRFGYHQVYTPKGKSRPRGYNEEKWHWSYLPVARQYLRAYSKQITYDMLTGFEGAEVAERLNVIPTYVFSINPKCH